MAAYEELVLADGDRVVAAGRVVVQDGATWLDPLLPVPAIYYPDGGPVHRATHLAVPLIGVHVAQLLAPRERDGVVEGYAEITGSWQQEVLTCQTLGPLPTIAADTGARWRTPPCHEPEGGWPRVGPMGNLPVGLDAVPPDVGYVSMALFRPTEQTVVAVISATDTAAVEEALRSLLGSALCVVQARWSRAQVDRARDVLETAMPGLGAYQTGETVSDQGQPLLTIRVVRLTPQLLAVLNQVPRDLVDLDVWLKPSAAGLLPREPLGDRP